jgi:hypothetical protein
MSSVLKIVCCALTTAVTCGTMGQFASQSASQSTAPRLSTTAADQTLVATFVPDPSAPPVITQGSGTR